MESKNYNPAADTVFEALQPGDEIGPNDNRFVLVEIIGTGGMGQVWKARDLKEETLEGGERFKALKVVHPQLQNHPRALDALKREASRASKLSHPNIINVYDWRQGRDGWVFVVMDYLQGRNLDHVLHDEAEDGKLSWQHTLELLKPIVAALDYAHSQSIIHRVWIEKYGSADVVDPIGLATAASRVVRGGSWYGTARNVRTAIRLDYKPNRRGNDLGFRAARVQPEIR